MSDPCDLTDHAIVGGFGVPGRAAAEWFTQHGLPVCIVELNPHTVERCGKFGLQIIAGNISEEATLVTAAVAHARVLVLAVPDDQAVLDATAIARRLNPTLRIIARVSFTSTGFEATRRGANDVIVAEQTVAKELVRHLENISFKSLKIGG